MAGINKKRSIEVINYEGPVLKLIESDFGATAVDQWGNNIAELNFNSLISYLRGDFILYDKSGKGWHYPSQHDDAKTDINKLMGFIQEIKR